MTFKANLLPNTDLGYNLGSSDLKWNIYGSITPAGTTAQFYRGDNTWSNEISGGLLKITNNSNTVTIGSQNSTYTHIYNSADIPFIFNKDVNSASKNWLGSTSYPWGGLRLGGTAEIQYQGTKANCTMIRMIDNTVDGYGNGIAIGGGGQTIIGGGESAGTIAATLSKDGGEIMYVANDGDVNIFSNVQNGFSTTYYRCATLDTSARFTVKRWDNDEETGVSTYNANNGYDIRMIVNNGATPDVGLYSTKHGMWLIRTTKDKYTYLPDGYTGAATRLAFSQAGLAASAITWLTCWNEYELRAISKAEMANAVDSAHKWVRIGGDTMTGQLNNTFGGSSTARHYENVAFYENNASSYTGTIKIKLPNTTSNMVMMVFRIIIFDYNTNSGCDLLVSGYTYNDKKWYNAAAAPQGTFTKGVRLAHDGTNYCILLGTTSSTWNYSKIILADVYSGYNAQPATGYAISLITSESGYTISQTLTTLLRADKIWGAVWNDYAEYRKNNEEEKELQQPGRCVHEIGDGRLALTTERLMRGCEIISDTFGFAIGQDIDNGYDTPIASNGRVLAYPYESIEEFATHIGYAVCSGPGGTVSIMTDDEARNYPWCIIGMISEIPTYEKWGTGNIDVNGRVWIRVR